MVLSACSNSDEPVSANASAPEAETVSAAETQSANSAAEPAAPGAVSSADSKSTSAASESAASGSEASETASSADSKSTSAASSAGSESASSASSAETSSSSVESISITDEGAADGEAAELLQNAQPSPAWVTELPSAKDESVTQLFIVGGNTMDSSSASASMHFRDEDGTWKEILSTPAIIGRDGMCPDADHQEGSDFTKTPIGIYRFNMAFGLADDPGCQLEYIKVDGDDYWSGDEREGMAYNQMVDINEYPDLDPESSVHFVDAEPEYQYCLNISFNEEGTPGRGSAIFLRCAGEATATGGSVAIPEESLRTVMETVKPDCVVIIDTMSTLDPDYVPVEEPQAETAEEAPAEGQEQPAEEVPAEGQEQPAEEAPAEEAPASEEDTAVA